jgi:outer membrane protein TolC
MFSPASQNNLVGAAFDLPIFDAGQRRADLGVRDAEYDVAVGQYNQTILTALREVADQTDMLKSLHVQLKIQSASTKAASKKYSLISKRYQHGIENYEQVLTSQVLYLQEQATQDYLQMQQRQTIALLYKALGYSA